MRYCFVVIFLFFILKLSATDLKDSLDSIYTRCHLSSLNLDFDVFKTAASGYISLLQDGKLSNPNYLTIVDLSQPSRFKRFYVIDIVNELVVYNTYVAHGKGSDPAHTGIAKYFSNTDNTNMSSIGFYLTGQIDSVHKRKHKIEMSLFGLEEGFNSHAFRRRVIMHEAWYVSDSLAKNGKIGRSWGCPALSVQYCKVIAQMIANGSCLFIWGKVNNYLATSPILNKNSIAVIQTKINKCWVDSVKVLVKTIGGNPIFRIDSLNIMYFTSGLTIDADGSPRAYSPNKNDGLDYLANAGKPGHWWGIVTDSKGQPILQTNKDPFPGFYISMTSLQDKSKKYTDPSKYVNSETVPYIVLPPSISSKFKLGDICYIYNAANGESSFAIFADIGPKNKIGEGSIKLAENLHIRSNPKNGGAQSQIIFILFENSGLDSILDIKEIYEIGQKKLKSIDINCLISKSE
jgi:hypothetical protein